MIVSLALHSSTINRVTWLGEIALEPGVILLGSGAQGRRGSGQDKQNSWDLWPDQWSYLFFCVNTRIPHGRSILPSAQWHVGICISLARLVRAQVYICSYSRKGSLTRSSEDHVHMHNAALLLPWEVTLKHSAYSRSWRLQAYHPG